MDVLLVHGEVAADAECGIRLGWDTATIRHARSRAEALTRVSERTPDVVVIDASCEDCCPLGLTRELRGAIDSVIIVTAREHDEYQLAEAVAAGADDYLPAPVNPAFFVPRIRAALRRASRSSEQAVCLGQLEIDESRHEVQVAGREVYLGASEFKVLVELAKSAGHVVPRDILAGVVWGDEKDVYGPWIRKHIQSLRRKVCDLPGSDVEIHTIPKVGYKLLASDIPHATEPTEPHRVQAGRQAHDQWGREVRSLRILASARGIRDQSRIFVGQMGAARHWRALRMVVRRRRLRARKLIVVSVGFVVAMFFAWLVVAVTANGLGLDFENVNFISASTDDDQPGSLDPGYTKDVASCTTVVSEDVVDVLITNGYPSYICTFTVDIKNTGLLPIKLDGLGFDVPSVLTVTDLTDNAGIELPVGETDTERFSVHVEQPSNQEDTYTFTITKTFVGTVTPTATALGATQTPAPVPTETPVATATPAGLPDTGGSAGTGSESFVGLLSLLVGTVLTASLLIAYGRARSRT